MSELELKGKIFDILRELDGLSIRANDLVKEKDALLKQLNELTKG